MLDQALITQLQAADSDTLLGTVYQKTLDHDRVDVAGLGRFGARCSYNHEPGCAIKAAFADGRISARRSQSYLRLKG